MMNLCIKNKIMLKRQIKGIYKILIKKDKGISADTLRAILLLEADVNSVANIIFNA